MGLITGAHLKWQALIRDGQFSKSKGGVRGFYPGVHVVKNDILRLRLALRGKLYLWLCDLYRIYGLLFLPVNLTFLNILVTFSISSLVKDERDWRRHKERHYKNLI
jgi:hypothetical protein